MRSRPLALTALGISLAGLACLLLAFAWVTPAPPCGSCPPGTTCPAGCLAAGHPFLVLAFPGVALLLAAPVVGGLAWWANRREGHALDRYALPLRLVGGLGAAVVVLGLFLWGFGPYPPYLEGSLVGFVLAWACFALSFRPLRANTTAPRAV